MSLHRRAAKRDANEGTIVKALEAHGCVVWRLSGKGIPDLLVLHKGKKWLADVKGAKEKATPAQAEAWEKAATQARCAIFILRTPEDAGAMLNNALAPWEPVVAGSIRAPLPHANIRLRSEREIIKERHLARETLASGMQPRKRQRCGKNGCKRGLPCVNHTKPWEMIHVSSGHATPACDCGYIVGRLKTNGGHKEGCAVNGYTPPRSMPVDAAKEAEVFAPPIGVRYTATPGEGCDNCAGVDPESCAFRSRH